METIAQLKAEIARLKAEEARLNNVCHDVIYELAHYKSHLEIAAVERELHAAELTRLTTANAELEAHVQQLSNGIGERHDAADASRQRIEELEEQNEALRKAGYSCEYCGYVPKNPIRP